MDSQTEFIKEAKMLVLMALRTPEMVEIKNEVHVPNSS
jgi:hypothetical protein